MELVGCMMYFIFGTRLDICYAVNYYSRFQDEVSYLKVTQNIGLEYIRNNCINICCYVYSEVIYYYWISF